MWAVSFCDYSIGLHGWGMAHTLSSTHECVTHECLCFAEAHAALTAVQWQLGQAGKAEEHFAIATAIDSRWKRVTYIQTQTRWPPKLYAAMEKFLSIVPG